MSSLKPWKKVTRIIDQTQASRLDVKWFRKKGIKIYDTDSLSGCIAILERTGADLGLIDLVDPKTTIETLKDLRIHFPDLAVSVMIDPGEMDTTGLQAIRLGAQDALSRQVDMETLARAIQTGVERQKFNKQMDNQPIITTNGQFGDSTVAGLDYNFEIQRKLLSDQAIYQVINSMACSLLSSDTWQDVIPQWMVSLGRTMEACRVSIYRNDNLPGAEFSTTRLFDWVSGEVNIAKQPGIRENDLLSTEILSRRLENLERCQVLAVCVEDLPHEMKNSYQDLGISTILVAPIYVGDNFWGIFEIDEGRPGCTGESVDVEIVQIAAGIIGAAIRRQDEMERLRINAQDMNRVLSNFPGFLIRFDRDLRCTYISSAIETLYGKSSSEIIGKTTRELGFPSENIDILENSLRNVFKLGRSRLMELKFLRNGSPEYYEVRLTPEISIDGIIGSVLVSSLNVTALRQTEEAYRTLVENSLQELIIFQDGKIAYANSAACKNNGISQDQMINQSIVEILQSIHPDDRSKVTEVIKSGQKMRNPIRCTFRSIRPGKKQRWLDVMISDIVYAGKPAIQVAQMDITEQKNIEERLQQTLFDLQTITSSISVALWMGELAPEECIRTIYVSPVIEKVLGYPVNYFLVEPDGNWMKLIHPKDRHKEQEIIDAALRRENMIEVEYRIIKPGGEIRWMRDSVRINYFAEGKTVFNGVVNDITDRKNAEAALKRANEQLQLSVEELASRNQEATLMNEMGDLLQSCLTLNEVYAVAANYGQRILPDHSGALFILNPNQHKAERVLWWGKEQINEKELDSRECWGMRCGRVHAYGNGLGMPLCNRGEMDVDAVKVCVPLIGQGEMLGLLFQKCNHLAPFDHCQQVITAIADRVALAIANVRLKETLRMQSIRDPLTGLFNRRYMDEMLEREVARAKRHHRSLGVVIADIDHFKSFNDRHGHQAGDVLLQSLSACLTSNVRGEDIVCRYGGEEFVIILPDITLEKIIERMEDVRKAVNHLSVEYHNHELGGISLSIGIAVFPQDGKNGSSLVTAADRALYSAKEDGRDRVVVALNDPE